MTMRAEGGWLEATWLHGAAGEVRRRPLEGSGSLGCLRFPFSFFPLLFFIGVLAAGGRSGR